LQNPQISWSIFLDFLDFTTLVNFVALAKLLEKDRTRGKGRTAGKESSCPRPAPIHELSVPSVVRTIAGVGRLPGCASPQLLHACPSARRGELKKGLDFLATTKTISVLPTFCSY